MNHPYFCKNEVRRLLVRDSETINGIDFLEVVSVDQRTIEVHFLNSLPGETGGVPNLTGTETLTKENIQITGGVRVKHIEVVEVLTNDNVLTIKVNTTGDFSTYRLRLVSSQIDNSPIAGFDPPLSVIEFSFKANCPSDFDCKTENICPPESKSEPRIDYLAKDFSSFQRLMLDRLSLLMPDWKERNIADLQIALVELLAYAGDHLSYYQDAVATEAYLFKARKRISIRRHARMLDYHLHNGANARAWVHIEVETGGSLDGGILPQGTVFLTKGLVQKVMVPSEELGKKLRENGLTIFENKHAIPLYSQHNEIRFYTWGDSECCLPKGCTKATLHNDLGLNLQSGQVGEEHADVLIFEEIRSPTTTKTADANPKNRHAVRLTKVNPTTDALTGAPILDIEWHEEDALPFALCISTIVEGNLYENISVARANIVLVDHGWTLINQNIVPSAVPQTGYYRPQLLHQGISVSEPYQHHIAIQKSATRSLNQNPHQAIPDIVLTEGEDIWVAQRDLLSSHRFAREFVAEIENNQSVQLRFGDDILGQKPGEGFQPKANYRIGNGRAGNVGAEAIGRVVWDTGGIRHIRNPLPAKGGVNAETTEEARQFAPEAFKTQERAVTEADYAAKTELHPQVQKTVAEFRWTGSWHTVFLTIDRKNGLDITDDFKNEIYLHLEKYRMAGYDLEIRSPLFVALEIELNVCVKQGYFKSHIKEKLFQVFSRYDWPDGTRGFFHPDNFTFGQAVYLSAIYQKAMQVEGVASVEIKTFKRQDRKADLEKEAGLLQPAANEIIRLDNDPNFPENGKINLLMFAGL